jgi:hypothetical protein
MRNTDLTTNNPRQRLLEYKSNTFDSNIQVRIIYDKIINAPTTEQTLENLKPVLEVTQQSIEDITIVVPKSADLNHYKELVTALFDKYKVSVEVWTRFSSISNN